MPSFKRMRISNLFPLNRTKFTIIYVTKRNLDGKVIRRDRPAYSFRLEDNYPSRVH